MRADLNKLRWRCRRGLKELDIILEEFARTGLDGLGAEQLDAFARLLELPDQDLLAALTDACENPDARVSAVNQAIATCLQANRIGQQRSC